MISSEVIKEMIFFFGHNKKFIAHALKVYAYAFSIAELEKLNVEMLESVVYASILHDVGIKIANEKYGACSFKQQEEEGPPQAKNILLNLGVNINIVDRVCYLIGNHHSPEVSEDIDFRILLEADYLVNLEEENIHISNKNEIFENHFRTKSGKMFFEKMFK